MPALHRCLRLLAASLLIPLLLAAASPGGRVLAVCGDQVLVVDPEGLKIETTLDGFEHPQAVAAGPKGRWLAACAPDRDLVQLLDRNTDKIKEIKADGLLNPAGLCFSPDGTRLWVLSRGLKALVELDPERGIKTRLLALEGPEPEALSLDDEGRRLLVVALAGTLSEVDPQSWQVKRQDMLVGPLAGACWWGSRVLVAQARQARILDEARANLLAVTGASAPVAVQPGLVLCQTELLRLQPDGQVSWHLPTAAHPNALTESADSRLAVIANQDSRDLQVIDVAAGTEKGRIAMREAVSVLGWMP